jgi:hypothetical protein
MNNVVIIAVLIVFLASGCSTIPRTSSLNSITVGMSKSEVINALGQPISTAAHGGADVLRYHLRTPEQIVRGGYDEYFVRLVGGRVESFGRMGDFDSTKNPTVEIRSDSRIATEFDAGERSGRDIYSELQKLEELRKQGILTQQEFELEKRRILDRR